MQSAAAACALNGLCQRQSRVLFLQVCAGSPTLVDCSTLPGVVRINMLPAVVAKRLSDKALSLLDGPLPASTNGGGSGRGVTRSASPPGTPK